MKSISIYDVLIRPVMTEKSMGRADSAYTFQVDLKANKFDIKRSVEEIFGVKVLSVNTAIRKGKKKNFRGRVGVQADRKFAYVRLAEGSINYEGGF